MLKSKPVIELKEFIRYNYRVWQSLRDKEHLLVNAEHKNSCNGDVYILFTGASLTGKNLNWLAGKNVIATNMFFMSEYYSNLNIQHYLLIEPWQYRKQWHLSWILEMIMLRAKADSPPTIWLHGSAKPYIDYDELHFDDINTRNLLNSSLFRYVIGKGSFYRETTVKDDLSRPVNSNVGTMTFALFFAAYLGYKKIYLLGSDYTKTPRVAGHFYDNVHKEVHGYDPSVGLSEEVCQFADDMNRSALSRLSNKGVEVINVVDDGYISREIKSVDYRNILGA